MHNEDTGYCMLAGGLEAVCLARRGGGGAGGCMLAGGLEAVCLLEFCTGDCMHGEDT